MTRRNGGSSPISGEVGGNRFRFAGRRTGSLGFRRTGIALGRFRNGNEQEEPEERKGYFRETRTQEHFADYIPQAGVRQQLSFDGKITKDGKPGNMHDRLGSSAAERAANLEIFRKWVGNWTLKRKKELSGEELDAIRAPER